MQIITLKLFCTFLLVGLNVNAAGSRKETEKIFEKLAKDDQSNCGKLVKRKPPADSKCSDKEPAGFWKGLFVGVAHYESGFDPTKKFDEPPPLNKPSVGLFQLSAKDVCNNGETIKEEDLRIPEANMKCACGIALRLLEREDVLSESGGGKSWKGLTRYWAVLRHSDKLPKIKKMACEGKFEGLESGGAYRGSWWYKNVSSTQWGTWIDRNLITRDPTDFNQYREKWYGRNDGAVN